MRKLDWRRLAFNLLIFLVLLTAIRLWQQRDIVEGAAPPLPGVVWQGKPRVVHFWASWCPVCRAEQSAIDALAQDYPETVTIAMQSGDEAAVRKFMQEQGLGFSVINDPDGAIAQRWGVHAVPTTFVVDGTGQIRFTEVGYTTGWGLRLRLWLAGFNWG